MAESNIIIIAYFFLYRPGEYIGFNSGSTPFPLKYTDFSFVCSIFAATATASKLQAANFVTLKFTTQNNGVKEENIGHKASGDPLFCPKVALLQGVLHLISHGALPAPH